MTTDPRRGGRRAGWGLLGALALAAGGSLLPACRGGARDAATADTAVLAARAADSVRRSGAAGDSAAPTDSTPGAAPASDTAGVAPDTADGAQDTATAPGAIGLALGVVTAADSAAGDSLFRRQGRCLTCHGRDAAGVARLGPSLRDAEWLHGDGSLANIAAVIAAGVSRPKQAQIRMPAFTGQLSQEEIARLAAYVYAISH